MRTIGQILKGTEYENNQVEYFWAKCWTDFCYFAEHLFEFDMAEYHNEWFELMEKYPRLCMESSILKQIKFSHPFSGF